MPTCFKNIKIEFQSQLEDWVFLYRLPDIKIAWINPWGRVQLVSVNFTLYITILFTFFVIFFKVCQEFELISTTL